MIKFAIIALVALALVGCGKTPVTPSMTFPLTAEKVAKGTNGAKHTLKMNQGHQILADYWETSTTWKTINEAIVKLGMSADGYVMLSGVRKGKAQIVQYDDTTGLIVERIDVIVK